MQSSTNLRRLAGFDIVIDSPPPAAVENTVETPEPAPVGFGAGGLIGLFLGGGGGTFDEETVSGEGLFEGSESETSQGFLSAIPAAIPAAAGGFLNFEEEDEEEASEEVADLDLTAPSTGGDIFGGFFENFGF